ncbi:unnamed protein product [Rotaria socialis]|uniref:HAT C-terminal dimerisation domain-containing protein n=1 Tax=Rotaria socialis TaxID=392032 RepID=A0A817UV07_9BILA|nr:unnamed protein product [Rotaria socialis]
MIKQSTAVSSFYITFSYYSGRSKRTTVNRRLLHRITAINGHRISAVKPRKAGVILSYSIEHTAVLLPLLYGENTTRKTGRICIVYDRLLIVFFDRGRTHRQVKLKQKLQLYSDTRFNGAFSMLNVFLNVYGDIGSVLNSGYIDYLTSVDKDLLQEVCRFLIVFDNAIDQLSERIKSIGISQDQHFICTFLHPRLKRFDAVLHEKDIAFDLVKRELLPRTSISRITTDTASKAVTTNVSIINDSTPPANPNNLLTCCFDKPRPIISSVTTPVKELNDYMELVVPDEESDDILLFWKNHEKSFPTLSEIVRDLYAIPASNTIVERLFSASKNIVTDRN